MNFWWCNQRNNWEIERPAQVVCSSDAAANPTYRKTVGAVAKGDVVVHYCSPHIVAFSRALENGRYYKKLPRVSRYDYGSGWRFRTDYFDLKSPIPRDRFARDLVGLIEEHYPVDKNGNIRQGYLFPFSPQGMQVVARFAKERLPSWLDAAKSNASQASPADDVLTAIKHLSQLDQTTREALVQARLKQGDFRRGLVAMWHSCSVTGCDVLEALVASHIKPWRDSSNAERLNVHNGLLLLGTLDRLFDEGLITFDPDGLLRTSDQLTSRQKSMLGVTRGMRLRHVHDAHLPFLAWHRRHVFQGSNAGPPPSRSLRTATVTDCGPGGKVR